VRKLIMWNIVTLDGYFEGTTPWDLAWHDYIWGEELEQLSIEQSKSTGMLLFGRLTYQGMADYWQKAEGEIADFMNTVPKAVFSRTLKEVNWNNTRLITSDTEQAVAKLKQEPGNDLYIYGSANLSAGFMKAGLIDEYRIGVAPVVLGGGTPLFKPPADRLPLKLLEARPLQSGGVILRYEPAREGGPQS